MRKLGSALLVVCVFGALAYYRIRSAPIPLIVGMVPLLALALFLIAANPDDPESFSNRVLARTGFSKVVRDVHASTLGGGVGGMIIRTLVVVALILWFWGVMTYWPA